MSQQEQQQDSPPKQSQTIASLLPDLHEDNLPHQTQSLANLIPELHEDCHSEQAENPAPFVSEEDTNSSHIPLSIVQPYVQIESSIKLPHLTLQNSPTAACDDELKLQNQQLRKSLLEKQRQCRQKNVIITQLSNNTKLQEKKIDLLTAQLNRVEALMQQLMKQNNANLNKDTQNYISPEPKNRFYKQFEVEPALRSQLKWDSDYLTTSKAQAYLNSSYVPMTHKKTQESISTPYLQKGYMTARPRKQASFGEAHDLSSYRREKLMNSKNLNDVIKLQKFMLKKQGYSMAI